MDIPTGTNCAALVADLFLFCYERYFMLSLSGGKQSEAFRSTSGYLGNILNIDNYYFDTLISQIYPSELQINKASPSETKAAFLQLFLSVLEWFISCKIYDKCDDFDFEIVNFPYFDVDVPRRASYGVYISQEIRFGRVSSYVTDFNTRNKSLTAKLLNQGYRCHDFRKAYPKVFRRHFD